MSAERCPGLGGAVFRPRTEPLRFPEPSAELPRTPSPRRGEPKTLHGVGLQRGLVQDRVAAGGDRRSVGNSEESEVVAVVAEEPAADVHRDGASVVELHGVFLMRSRVGQDLVDHDLPAAVRGLGSWWPGEPPARVLARQPSGSARSALPSAGTSGVPCPVRAEWPESLVVVGHRQRSAVSSGRDRTMVSPPLPSLPS